jgi:DNA-directed RNA polymerase specialized sigma24 family protein
VRDPDAPDSIARLINGDPNAFNELYKFAAESLRLFIKKNYGRLGLTFQDAEEIANDALLEAHKNITNFRPGERSLKTLGLMKLRRSQRMMP